MIFSGLTPTSSSDERLSQSTIATAIDTAIPRYLFYLEALAVVDDPTPAIRQLDNLTTRKKTASGRGVPGFNPLSQDDIQLFKAMMAGEHYR